MKFLNVLLLIPIVTATAFVPLQQLKHNHGPRAVKPYSRIREFQRVIPIISPSCQLPVRATANANGDDSKPSGNKKEKEPLTPEKIAELIEVSFVQGVMQLSQGYVDVIKLFIAAVTSGYQLGLSPKELLNAVAACPEQSANRPLMDEELELRTTWIQVVYMVLDHVAYQDKQLLSSSGDNDIDQSMKKTYGSAIPELCRLRESGNATWDQETLYDLVPRPDSPSAYKEAILSQTLKVAWLTLTVLEEEENAKV